MTLAPHATMPRRHDLDALRAFAMLLGVVLHGALSFLPLPWPVQDSQQHEQLGWGVAAVHGFRMPVFFVMSGFFTAMLWRRRGLRALLGQRARRIGLPLLLGVLTVVPAVNGISRVAIVTGLEVGRGEEAAAAGDGEAAERAPGFTALSIAAALGQDDEVAALLEGGADVNARNADGSSALTVAAVFDRAAIMRRLIDAGAALEVRNDDGSTPVHAAAFFGRSEAVRLLVEAGADIEATNRYGQTALSVTATDWATTAQIAALARVEVERAELEAGRARVAELLRQGMTGEADEGMAAASGGLLHTLMARPVVHHLWFLSFLCWLVAGFAVYAWVAERFGWRGLPRVLMLSPLRMLWLIPLTAVPQFFMGQQGPVFGADTSAGVLPMPHVLAFYALFFGFGALYYDSRDEGGRVGRWFWLSIPVGLLVLLPVGLGLAFAPVEADSAGGGVVRVLSALVQASYAWVMVFGLMGLFRVLCSRSLPSIRYLADASYWIYIVHLPLIIGAQMLVRDWPLPALVKLGLVVAAVTGVTVALYQGVVRHTWLGRLLNGPRARKSRLAPALEIRDNDS